MDAGKSVLRFRTSQLPVPPVRIQVQDGCKPVPIARLDFPDTEERMRILCVVFALAMAPGGYAQLIGSRSIVNSASYMAPGLPAGPYVGALPLASPAALTAGGLDTGAIYAGAFIGKTVIFQ
jgi:hypothetical protein